MPGWIKYFYFVNMKMKWFMPSALLLALSLAGCKGSGDKQVTASENNIDAARNFIRAALDGKFNEARGFMLQDSLNTNYMDLAERSYQNTDPATRNGYKTSSIRIHSSQVTNPDDSTSIVIYSNSFKNDPDTLKVLRINGQWLVDLKYLYEHDADTLLNRQEPKDTLK